MSEHISQKIRRILDASFSKKNYLFWIFFPILILISCFWAFTAFLRRLKGYKNFDVLAYKPKNLSVVCIGNILVGGTGKSPIVRAYSEKALKNNYLVGIASRGIHKKNTIIDSLIATETNLRNLSDENREHFEILKSKFPDKQFFIYQNKNRLKSLKHFIKSNFFEKYQKAFFIMDDGLQHFSCPRDINICVCDPNIDGIAPAFSLPLGPYREGFGKKSIQKIISKFDLCLWPLKHSSRGIFPFKHPHHIQVPYKTKFVKISKNKNQFVFHECNAHSIDFKNQKILILAGIAHPDRFLNDLKILNNNFSTCERLFLSDHGQLSASDLKKISSHHVLILTLKDLYRFSEDVRFTQLTSNQILFGCFLEYDLSFLRL